MVSDVRRLRAKLNATLPGNALAHVTAAELAKPAVSGIFWAHLMATRCTALGRRDGSAIFSLLTSPSARGRGRILKNDDGVPTALASSMCGQRARFVS